MKIDNPFEPRQRRSYVIVDLESAVLDEDGHQRYRAMERWVPGQNEGESRRGYICPNAARPNAQPDDWPIGQRQKRVIASRGKPFSPASI